MKIYILHCENDDTLVIDNKDMDINRIQEHKPEGRRIVDISFFFWQRCIEHSTIMREE